MVGTTRHAGHVYDALGFEGGLGVVVGVGRGALEGAEAWLELLGGFNAVLECLLVLVAAFYLLSQQCLFYRCLLHDFRVQFFEFFHFSVLLLIYFKNIPDKFGLIFNICIVLSNSGC